MRAVTITSAVVLLAATPAAAAVARNGYDEQEVIWMRGSVPHAVELLEKGEALGASGALEAAEALFRQAEAEAPTVTLLRRRHCEALTALGRRDEAINECILALQDQHTSNNQRAMVRSLVDGPTAPSISQLFQALAITSIEGHRSPGGIVPTAMACDIAESIGDGVMLKQCAEKLDEFVPNDSETRRAMAMLRSQCPPVRFWAGWLSIVAAVLVTVGHALWRIAPWRRIRATAVVAAIALAVMPRVARADGEVGRGFLSKRGVDERNPEKNMPTEKERNADPLEFGYWIQDVALMAERASKHGDHAKAVGLYLALAKAVPEGAISYSKLCEEYQALGDRDNAIAACGDALLRDGVRVADYRRFVELVAGKPGTLTPNDIAALGNVIVHMKEDAEGRKVVDELECEVGVRTSNLAFLRECTAALAARAPEDPKTTTYQWALAVQEGKFGDADKLIDRARIIGVRPENVENMKRTTAAGQKRHWLRQLLVVLGIGLLLSSGGAAAREIARRRKASKDAAAPALPAANTAVPG